MTNVVQPDQAAASDIIQPRPAAMVVMPVYNAMQYLPATVPAVLAAIRRHGRARLIAVDNGSTDASAAFLEALAPDVAVLRHPGVTISALRNAGARAGDEGVIAFVDADCLVEEDHLVESMDVLERTGAAATGAPYALPSSPHWVERVWQGMHHVPGSGYVRHVNAGNFICRRGPFLGVGGFDEGLVTGEDAELCLRLVTAGHRIYASSSIVARHLGNPKSLAGFFRKQVWHSLGMLGTFRVSRLDRPLLMTYCFLLTLMAAPAAAVVVRGWPGALVALLLIAAVPLASVAYRALTTRSRPWLVRGTLLYGIYYAARAYGLLRLMLDRQLQASARSGQALRG